MHSEERTASSINGGKLDMHLQKNEIGPLFYVIYSNQLKMGCRFEDLKSKTPRRKHRGKSS